jgi:hypothetical protein
MTCRKLSTLNRRIARFSADNFEWLTELSAPNRRITRFSADKSERTGGR